MVKIFQANLHVVHKLRQHGCGARGGPVVPQFRIGERVDQAEGVEDVHHVVVAEMIAVVVGRQQRHGLVECAALIFCQFADFGLEIAEHFFLRDAADGRVFGFETDVAQIVEYGEEGDLCKLGDARDEDKLLVFVVRLQDGEDLSVDAGAGLVVGRPPGVLQRRVVLVDEDGYLLARLVVSTLNDILESYGKRTLLAHDNPVFRLQVMESVVQIASHTFGFCSGLAHVEPYDGPLHPFPLQLHDPQSLEELPLAQEVGFERIDEHRLAKAARAAQVVVLPSPVGKLPDDVCLVNIKVSILPDFLKRLNAYGQSSVSCLCHSFLFLFANIRFFPQSSCFFLHSLSIIMLVLCPKRVISAEMCKG